MLKVGICITTFNNEDIVEKNLLSALEQKSVHNVHVYVVDDGSADQTPSILSDMAQRYSSLHVLLNEHKERGVTREIAIDMALKSSCDYFLFVDSDMWMAPNLVEACINESVSSGAGAIIIPEVPFSTYNNYMTRVKVFERELVNSAGETMESHSVEAARFWRLDSYHESGGLNATQIAFEETQPTIRYQESGGLVRRVLDTYLTHDEGLVTIKNLFEKKSYYFSKINQTLDSEDRGFMKALSRWYFFRPYLYSRKSLGLYIKKPAMAVGLFFMYVSLTIMAVTALVRKYI